MKLNWKAIISVFIVIIIITSGFIAYFQSMYGQNKAQQLEIAVFETSMGTIEIQLDRQHAPITVENFVRYLKSGFYNGTIFHRVIPDFVIQGGGFTTDGVPKETFNPIKLESTGLKNKLGTISMARTNEPNSATSQFFINLIDNADLDPRSGYAGYAVFGQVVKGIEIVKAIGSVKTDTRGYFSDWPIQDVVIIKCHLKTSP